MLKLVIAAVVATSVAGSGAGSLADQKASGCASGQKAGFIGYQTISACEGGWGKEGIVDLYPEAGGHKPLQDEINDCFLETNFDGVTECSASHICAVGWHVCKGQHEVKDAVLKEKGFAHGCESDNTHWADGAKGFFATSQSGHGSGHCSFITDGKRSYNDVFGCSTTATATIDNKQVVGDSTTVKEDCDGLTHFTHNHCGSLPSSIWSCLDDTKGWNEAETIRKLVPEYGGVICCLDVGPGGFEPGPFMDDRCGAVDVGPQ